MWKSIVKKLALRSYRRRLPDLLRRRYGRETHYRPEQVESVARDHGFRLDYLCFAFAMFCERGVFDELHAARGETCDYDAMHVAAGEPCSHAVTAHDHGHHGHDGHHHGGGHDGMVDHDHASHFGHHSDFDSWGHQ